MLNICSLCLCTGIQLQTLGEALNKFYNELCNITDGYSLCCTKCAYLLRKFYNFRNRCQKANYVLNKWKNESQIMRIPLNELNTKLSPTSLGLNNERIIYCYYNEDYTKCKSYSDLNNFISCNSKDLNELTKSNEISSENNVKKEFDTAIKIKSDDDNTLDDFPIVFESLKTEQQFDNDDDDDTDNYDDIVLSHYREKVDVKEERPKKRKKSSEVSKDEPKRKRHKKILKRDIEDIKRSVKKYLGNKKVNDKDGNVIDVDVIINHLDKMHKKTYVKIQRYCTGKEPLTPEAIEFFGQIHKRYGDQYSSVFDTKHLSTDEEIMEDMRKRETSKDYLQSENKCTQCFKYFKSAKLLDYHVTQFHDPSKPHKCQYCSLSFSGRRSLTRHLQTHRVAYQCKLCPLVTNHTSVMAAHFNIHTGVKYPCTKCNSVFKSPPALSSHMNNKHHVVSSICPCCARKFHSKQGLNQHMMKKHRDDINTVGPSSAKCEECDIQFISDEVFLDHVKKIHMNPDGTTSANFPKIRREATVRKTPRYTCRVCKHIESSLGALMWHFKSEHPSEEFDRRRIALRAPHPYLCHECGKGFQALNTFNDHKNVHTGARPYTCTECPKAFHCRRLLKHHILYHLPPTFQCPHCEKKFHSGSDLNMHKEKHSGLRRYACELCGQTFLRQSTVTKHVRRVHGCERKPPKLSSM